jgi:hypothetical protein
MAIRGQAFLTSPDGKTLLDRLLDQGMARPNFWMGYAWGPITNSEPAYRPAYDAIEHLERRFIFSPDFHRLGVSVFRRGDQLYTAVVFTD